MASTRAGRLTPGNFVCSEAQCEAPEDVIYAASSLTSCLREEARLLTCSIKELESVYITCVSI